MLIESRKRKMTLGTMMAVTAITLIYVVLLLIEKAFDLKFLNTPVAVDGVYLTTALFAFLISLAITVSYWRGWEKMVPIGLLLITSLLSFSFDPIAFESSIPQSFWIPFIAALALSTLPWALLILVASIAAVMIGYEDAFQARSTILSSVAIFILLISGYLISTRSLRTALEAKSHSEQISQALKQSEEKYRTLINNSPLGIQVIAPDGYTSRVNRAWEKLWGVKLNQVHHYNVFKDRQLEEIGITKSLKRAFKGEMVEFPVMKYDRGEHPDNPERSGTLWVRSLIYPIFEEGSRVKEVVLIQENVTEQKKQEEKILHQAHFDSLTNLPNRFLVVDRLKQLLLEAHRNQHLVAVLFLDLDDFKKINDSLGHETGDNLLIEASHRLEAVLREGDTVGRLGGDEFLVVLGGLNSMLDIRPIADKLLHCFRDPFLVEGRELMVSTSMGIACYPEDGETPEALMRNADTAMYHSKAQGRNTYNFYTDSMNKEILRRLELEEKMYCAIDRKEFYLCYQPVIDAKTGKIISLEALLRWDNPDLGIVPPDEFIPIAEQTGQIVSIGYFVIKESLKMAAECRAVIPDLSIAINISPQQFRDMHLLERLSGMLAHFSLTNDALHLEITEGVLINSDFEVTDTLDKMKSMGIGISMDDFGTGYSSLSYLRNYPFSALKIDRSFVADITLDSKDYELVNAAISMAHSLGLQVVAEGVETAEQLAILRELKCDYVQGYYFSKPVKVEELKPLLTKSFL